MDLIVIALIFASLVLMVVLIFSVLKNRSHQSIVLAKLETITGRIQSLDSQLRQDFKTNREETNALIRENRIELSESLKAFKQETTESLRAVSDRNQSSLDRIAEVLEKKISALIDKMGEINTQSREALSLSLKEFTTEQKIKFNELKAEQKELTIQLTFQQQKLIESTEKKLDEIRNTVDEKLQKTLNERLGQSFALVGKQLENVQKGLGEMQTLAQDVGGLKRVLSNVKMRGGFGEVQLSLLLEQILAPEQYEQNVCTKRSGNEVVEFAIKLPGKDEATGVVWLPIDAKFPRDTYENLQTAYDSSDLPAIETEQKNLENTIKKMARDICEKYIDPPFTTDFAIMFLPFEGIYAEVVRKASLLEELQRSYKVIVTGPTTLAAILNSLQMGFRTLTIQKRSSEVWSILAGVKKEFENFSGMLEKAQKNIQTASNQIDEVMGKRTRAIQRKLRNIETSPDPATPLLFETEPGPGFVDDEPDEDD
ncbi:MAG: DNA recombination protein RmuC [Lentimicrobium sp.]|jgi:DNA recombination protein RmuC|nr:DNA recombination protein RmuC [Lentimicrobium sp.]